MSDSKLKEGEKPRLLSEFVITARMSLIGPILVYTKVHAQNGESELPKKATEIFMLSVGGGSIFASADYSREPNLDFGSPALLFLPQNSEGSGYLGRRTFSFGELTLYLENCFGNIGLVSSCRFSNEDLKQKDSSKVKILQGWKEIQGFLCAREDCYQVVSGFLKAEASYCKGSSNLVNSGLEENCYELFKVVAQGEVFHQQRLNEVSEGMIARIESALRPKKI